jgi:hypothetical protein
VALARFQLLPLRHHRDDAVGMLEIVRGSAADIPRLEPLWVAVHHVHQESMPELAPYVDDTTTWAYHVDMYAELLAKPDSILLLALVDGELAG